MLRRALSGAGFAPMPTPAEGDWLSDHPERGQKYAEFVAEKPLVPDETRRTLALLPLGVPARSHIPGPKLLRDALASFYALPVRLLPRARSRTSR